MARPKRINIPFCLYHVISRGNPNAPIFRENADKNKFLYYLDKYADLYSFRIHAYCLMETHLHLLLESSEQNLPDLMHRLLTAYTVWFNRRHETWGHLFSGRYKSLVVDKGSYLVAVSRYIHLNPVEAGLVEQAQDYTWSSMKYYLHPESAPPYLYTKEILSWFHDNVAEHEKFVREGMSEENKPKILAQRFVSGEFFADRLQERLKSDDKHAKESPAEKKKIKRDSNKKERFQKADNLLNIVCKFLGCKKDKLRYTKKRKGAFKTGFMMLVLLLRERTTLIFREIGEYLGCSPEHAQHIYLLSKNDEKVLQNVDKIRKGLGEIL
ncbi:transposase [Candidatus Sumerlaeota bacterium]|nr:transposase [Candidatus Sumerlaeota bacterium]